MLQLLDLDRIYTSYGFPNDMLVHLNVWNARVRDFQSRPIYGVGERSGIRIHRVVPRISWLLWKGFFWRMREKYVIRDFHPLVFFYFLGFLMTTVGLALGIFESVRRIGGHAITPGDDRARRAAAHLGQPVHALRDVVRHGVEQGPALKDHLPSSRRNFTPAREGQLMRALRVVFVAVLLAGVVAALAGSSRASFPGSSGRIFFTASSRGTSTPSNPPHLYSMNANGSDVRQLTSGSASDGSISVASSGDQVVLSRDTNAQCGHAYWAQGFDLFEASADGSSVTRLTNDCPFAEFSPAFSPSGRHVVFSKAGSLWSMRLDGTDLARLTCPAGDDDYQPDWSPDGRTIAFDRDNDLYVMDADGSNLRFVATGGGPSFSPDGTRLAYVGPVFTAASGIHVVALDGSGDVQLTHGFDGPPAWSPDGTKVAYVNTPDPAAYLPTSAIWTINANGTGGATKIMDTLDPGDLAWAATPGAAEARSEPDLTAAETACAESAPLSPAPPAPPPALPGVPVSAYVPASAVTAPDRLRVARVAFVPQVLRARKTFSLTVQISDLAGRAVLGAAVRVTPLRGDATASAQVQTRKDGTAVLRVTPTRQLRLARGGRLTLAVHVRRPRDPWTAEVAGLRLVSVRTASK